MIDCSLLLAATPTPEVTSAPGTTDAAGFSKVFAAAIGGPETTAAAGEAPETATAMSTAATPSATLGGWVGQLGLSPQLPADVAPDAEAETAADEQGDDAKNKNGAKGPKATLPEQAAAAAVAALAAAAAKHTVAAAPMPADTAAATGSAVPAVPAAPAAPTTPMVETAAVALPTAAAHAAAVNTAAHAEQAAPEQAAPEQASQAVPEHAAAHSAAVAPEAKPTAPGEPAHRAAEAHRPQDVPGQGDQRRRVVDATEPAGETGSQGPSDTTSATPAGHTPTDVGVADPVPTAPVSMPVADELGAADPAFPPAGQAVDAVTNVAVPADAPAPRRTERAERRLGDDAVDSLAAADASSPSAPSADVAGTRAVAAAGPSGLADRVAAAVEALQGMADPKRISLDLDELGGLRLAVSLRGERVHVDVLGSRDSLPPGWDRELEQTLRERGFSYSGEGSRRGDDERQDQRGDGWRPQATRRETARSGAGLRL